MIRNKITPEKNFNKEKFFNKKNMLLIKSEISKDGKWIHRTSLESTFIDWYKRKKLKEIAYLSISALSIIIVISLFFIIQ